MITKFPLKIPGIGPIIGGPVFDLIIKGAKKLWNNITNSKKSEEIASKDKFDSANIGDVIDHNKLINEFIMEIEDEISAIEEKIVLECVEYYEELILLVKAVEDSKKINLQSKRIQRDIERLKRDSKGNLIKSLYKNVSLDNSELKKVLSLPAGELKKSRLDEFKTSTIKQVINDFILDIKVSLEDFSEDISNDLNRMISDISNNNAELLDELTIIENSEENEEKAKGLLELAKVKTLLCDEIINELKE